MSAHDDSNSIIRRPLNVDSSERAYEYTLHKDITQRSIYIRIYVLREKREF